MKIGFVIPARLKSTRLPKKILLDLNGETALGWAIERAKKSRYIDEVIVATTGLKIDSEITKVCRDKKIRYYQGDGEDVLKRLKDTAEYFDLDFVVNITPDNTLFSPYMIDLMVSEIKKNPNIDFCKFKDVMLGAGIYALKKEALDIACEFKSVIDTEIWGPIFNNHFFNVKDLEVPEFLKRNYRLTLDTEEDYKFLKKLYKELNINKDNIPELYDIIDYLDNTPSLVKINSSVKQASLDKEILKKIENNFIERKEIFEQIKAKKIGGRNF